MLRLSALAATAAFAAAASSGRLRSAPVTGVCPDPAAQEAGYFDIDAATNKHYFYYSAASRNDPANDPIVMWMTGGPGCSSLLAMFTENGPCLVDSTGPGTSSSINPFGWNNNATAIWVDQPAGVGFSYADQSGYDHDEAGVARDMYAFLQAYFKAHPQLQGNEFYIFAESYGGHYAPAVSKAVFDGNNNLAPGDVKINLKGVGIGNGLTNPEVQYPQYATMAYNYSIQKLGHPVISKAAYEGMVKSLATCIPLIQQCQNDTSVCATAQALCNDAEIGPYEQTGLNPYDIRKPCAVPPLCYDMSAVTTFLNLPATQKALGVDPGIAWQTCNFNVNGDFASDWMKEYHTYLVPQLEAGTRVLIYAGDVDFICNWLGNQAWTLGLEWSGQAGFNAAPVQNWTLPGASAASGSSRTYGGLTFLRVFDAGHMVPSDQPAAALQLLNQVLYNLPFHA